MAINSARNSASGSRRRFTNSFQPTRGAVSAELTFMDQELDDGLRAVQDKFASVGTEILESHALRVTRGIERAQGI